jgi:hypothetical protein
MEWQEKRPCLQFRDVVMALRIKKSKNKHCASISNFVFFDINEYLLVIFREGLTGSKFGVKIWTRIGGSCLGLLQTKTMLSINEEK